MLVLPDDVHGGRLRQLLLLATTPVAPARLASTDTVAASRPPRGGLPYGRPWPVQPGVDLVAADPPIAVSGQRGDDVTLERPIEPEGPCVGDPVGGVPLSVIRASRHASSVASATRRGLWPIPAPAS